MKRVVGILAAVAMTGQSREPVGDALSNARAQDGTYISWREHVIDDESIGGVAIRGGDGLVMADLDRDGYLDVISVHESDTEYDGNPEGHIRLAFGSESPDRWTLVTLAEGADAGGAEDVAVGDVNGDGYPDVVAACELAHLIYLENPGPTARSARWERLVPPLTRGRGSFIRVFLADLNGDGRPEVVAANKGAQNPDLATIEPRPISWFEISGSPLDGRAWVEHELTRVRWPINSQPVDLDSDGDVDIVGGSVAEGRIFWFENARGEFREHAVSPISTESSDPVTVNGFNMEFVDLNGDGRLDIVLFEADGSLGQRLLWLEQPETNGGKWKIHRIGATEPDDIAGVVVADIDGDGRPDVMTGGYSWGRRDVEGDVSPGDPLGRIAWFQNPGDESAAGWIRNDVSRRTRGMFDKFVARDMDGDGDVDFVSTRGNSAPYDGVFWLEQVRSDRRLPAFQRSRDEDSEEMPLPPGR